MSRRSAVVRQDGDRGSRRPRPPSAVERLESRRLLTTALSFSGAVAFPAEASSVVSVAVGRFDADAYPDLAVATFAGHSTGPGEVRILLNNGNGTFRQSHVRGIDRLARNEVVGDFNNDGKRDVAALQRGNVNDVNNRLVVLLGNGDGTLQPPLYVTVTPTILDPFMTGLAIDDFDRDGKTDFVVSGHNMPLVVMLGNGAGGILGRINITPGGHRTVTAGDVNGDNRPDLLTNVVNGNGLEIRLGLGNGNFANPDYLLSAGPAEKVLLSDYNGDGKPDLAIAESVDVNDLSQGVRMFVGDGLGQFTFKGRYNPGVPGYDLASADFDGDFVPDVAVGSDAGEFVAVYTGKGDGALNPAVRINYPGLNSFRLVTADFNLDGKTDILAGDSSFPTNLILLTNTAVFHSVVTGRVYNDFNASGAFDPFESGSAGRTVYDDANDNGLLDAGEPSAVTNADGLYRLLVPPGTRRIRQVLPANWSQTTPANPPPPRTGAQVVTAGQYQIFGGRNFGATQLGSISGRVYYDLASDGISNDSDPGRAGFVVFLDANLDGVLNPPETRTTTNGQGQYTFTGLYPANYSVRVVKPVPWEQTAPAPAAGQTDAPFNTRVNGGFDASYTDFGVIQPSFVSGRVFDDRDGNGAQANTGEPGLPEWFVFVDLNGNGLAELSEPVDLTDASGNFRVRSPFSGTYALKVIRPSGWQSTAPASGVRQVGLAVGSELSNQNFGVKQGAVNNAGFRPPLNLRSGTGDFSNPVGIATGDFNQDGRPDFVSANNSADLTVYLNDGVGGFASSSAGFAGASVRHLITADLNNDGKPDLVTANQDSNDVSVLLGNGNGTFQLHVDYAAGEGAQGVAAADVNNDQKLDLVVANKFSDQLSLLLGNGNGTFAAATNVANVYGGVSVAAGDLNGDGRVDLVVANQNASSVSVLFRNANGTYQTPDQLMLGIVNPAAVALAHLNADNLLDLVVVNRDSDTVLVRTGAGNDGFNFGTSFPVGSTPTGVAVGDIDGDGRADLVVACQSDGTTDVSGGVSVLRNLGNAAFDAPLTSTAHTSPTAVGLADFNGDGLPDLAAANFFSDDVSVMINDRAAAAAAISGVVFDDANGDGVRAAAEPGLPGRTLFVDANGDGAPGPGEPTATTDAAGAFLFPPLPPGAYVVRQVPTDGWSQTAPAPGAGRAVTLAAGQTAALQFGLRDSRAPAAFEAALAPAAGPMTLRLVFDEDLGATLTAADLVVTNLDTGLPVAAQAQLVKSLSGGFLTATFTFPAAAAPDGNYRAVLPAAAATDAAGNPLAADVALDFFVLAADANRDRAVDFNDLVPLAQNYNTAGGKTFAQGDFNYDDRVDFNDLVLLAQRYNTTLAPAPAAAAPAVAAPAAAAVPKPQAKALFSTTPAITRPALVKPAPVKPTVVKPNPVKPQPIARPRPR